MEKRIFCEVLKKDVTIVYENQKEQIYHGEEMGTETLYWKTIDYIIDDETGDEIDFPGFDYQYYYKFI